MYPLQASKGSSTSRDVVVYIHGGSFEWRFLFLSTRSRAYMLSRTATCCTDVYRYWNVLSFFVKQEKLFDMIIAPVKTGNVCMVRNSGVEQKEPPYSFQSKCLKALICRKSFGEEGVNFFRATRV